MIVNNSGGGTGAHVTVESNDNEIHENCFIDNEPQAMDNGTNNNWTGNYWFPPPGGIGDYTISGSAGSEDADPLDDCPLISLNFSKTDDVGDCVNLGDTITYTICYDNLANPVAVHNVTINVTLPAGVTFDSASDGGSYDAGTRNVTWDIGTVQAGVGETCVMLNVTVNAGTEGQTLRNCAKIESDETEPATACEDTQVVYTVEPKPVPALTPIGMLALIGVVGLVLILGTIRRRED
ncbi:MAG: hypothetical protein AEth_01234 [Candidatus Argoarchaeum ethanivorans]|uniref:DUF11 domain-containing protein n=1 Tax=Candidatus Argoarchaeum ethanivorans TaxID=2608793 RepID=A0A8B3S166_9EURY|nr:MAG: hypothetical protein AEth_01234 [Candidatus Argoarchaeum ethanivorans]